MKITPDQQNLVLADPDHSAPTGGWRQPFAELPARLRTHRGIRFIQQNWLFAAFVLAALATVATVLWIVYLLVAALVDVLTAAGGGLGWIGSRAGAWITGGPVTSSISDPVRAFLDGHTAGLPATGHDLWITWLVTAGVLYVAGLAGSRYARIGWAVIGVLTAVAAYFGAAAATGPAAAGLTTAVWLLLSLPVYARAKSASVFEQIALDLAARRAARQKLAARRA